MTLTEIRWHGPIDNGGKHGSCPLRVALRESQRGKSRPHFSPIAQLTFHVCESLLHLVNLPEPDHQDQHM